MQILCSFLYEFSVTPFTLAGVHSLSWSSGGVVGPDFEPERILHHVDKLVVVNLAVAIRVHALE